LTSTATYPRILLKLSGEAFAGQDGNPIDGKVAEFVAREIVGARELGVDIAVVVGGGNIWRGLTGAGSGMDRAQADYMGMLATVINALALQDTLEQMGQPTRVQTAIHMAQIAEPYIRRRAIRHLEKGRVVIFGAGMGLPYFSTDTVAAQRALESRCEVVLVAKNGVDGVYTADPRKDPTAVKLDRVTYDEAISQGLRIMDQTAFALCGENKLPMIVFGMEPEGNILKVVQGEKIGTLVSADA
jgi:uridylate kinase